jgi:hypothetical protein
MSAAATGFTALTNGAVFCADDAGDSTIDRTGFDTG